ncbi:GNAT family N-acetyltransferase [Terasakiella sp. A23]|uniref:GNAT family N-acetyltransferase n=1 Tax=Terasakiella sp. FCG-A23 TaxID=3080561 RepID=UPI0029553AB5|nr:GNAT family N-acetyltransferase [Terasakiella sp. A23]MDV7339604.1 GNAT family N-acetyltransferase [Terasakiella sp. A23]
MTQIVSIQYQHAATDDIGDLLMLEDLCFGRKKSYRKLLKRFFQAQVARCIVAKLNDRVIGYALTVFSPNMKTATVNALCVHPVHRNQGIGETLLNWAEMDAVQIGASQIGIEIQYENDSVRHLLSENGYSECTDPLVLIPEHTDGVKMRKRLASSDFDSAITSNAGETEMTARNADHFDITSH